MAVTAKHWWSPKERKAARLAAKVLEYERDNIRKASVDAMLHGTSFVKPDWR